MKYEIRKLIALLVIGSYMLMSLYGFLFNVELPESLINITLVIVGYYFLRNSSDFILKLPFTKRKKRD